MAETQDPRLIATRAAWLLVLGVAACGGGGSDDPVDARPPPPDAPPPVIDGPPPGIDSAGFPPPGFGDITGMCGWLTTALDATGPYYLAGELTFAEPYDDPEDRAALTAGGLEVILDGNAGGSSIFSEAFAMEWLSRCEAATLLKTETEIIYTDPTSKKADLLVDHAGQKLGVSVTRAVTFPFGSPYTLDAALTLLDRKLDDIQLATLAVAPEDLWSRQVLSILAYDAQHAAVAMEAWSMLDAETRDDTILIVTVTSGEDLFIYTDM